MISELFVRNGDVRGAEIREALDPPVLVLRLDSHERVVCSVPPYVSTGVWTRYAELGNPIAGVSMAIQWNIRAWPGIGPRVWRQTYRDGLEVVSLPDAEFKSDIQLELDFVDFFRMVTGAASLEDLLLPVTVDGALGALSTLDYLQTRPVSLRGPLCAPQQHRIARSGLPDIIRNSSE